VTFEIRKIKKLLNLSWKKSYISKLCLRRTFSISDFTAWRGTLNTAIDRAFAPVGASRVGVEGTSAPVVEVRASCEDAAEDVNGRRENAGLAGRMAMVATREIVRPLEMADRLCANTWETAMMNGDPAGCSERWIMTGEKRW
jgi:hypothetical protein